MILFERFDLTLLNVLSKLAAKTTTIKKTKELFVILAGVFALETCFMIIFIKNSHKIKTNNKLLL